MPCPSQTSEFNVPNYVSSTTWNDLRTGPARFREKIQETRTYQASYQRSGNKFQRTGNAADEECLGRPTTTPQTVKAIQDAITRRPTNFTRRKSRELEEFHKALYGIHYVHYTLKKRPYHIQMLHKLEPEDFPGEPCRQWIGRRGSREWSPRSPDLNPLNFTLWCYLKEKVYKVKICDLQHLRTRIEEKCHETTADMLHCILNSMKFHLQTCYEPWRRSYRAHIIYPMM
ncbi:hypothetical protein ANN_25826 [Periplaneta americana]|uniref:Uncharacterized protein n=1 Tax=Periplaneta americana TaxID=6978 RepID=A0ABQ8S493_PERAM|nr:hypothetical protein ANN_25826 [Periplaneta americana]